MVQPSSTKKKITSVKDTSPLEKRFDKQDTFPIVGIGASAGGLEALEQFLQGVPANSGFAYVIIQHLDPNHKGIMKELLQRNTKMKVFEATDKVKVKNNSVYLIPPNRKMSISKGRLLLFEPDHTENLKLPIDFFFRSLAEDKKEHSIGMILSGMGSDGSLGLQAIKEKGGNVLVQEPADAKFDSMPLNAINSTIVDIIAPAIDLGQKLVNYYKKIPHLAFSVDDTFKDKSSFEKIMILLRSITGHDFSLYKKSLIYRRIERRMGINQINKISLYVDYLNANIKEAHILFKELLIGVTSFFRDTEVWDFLLEKSISELLKNSPDKNTIRVWIAGCSSGEEAYSMAIILKEAVKKLKFKKSISFQIFATDLDEDAIEKARKGIYPENITADVSPKRISKYFLNTENGYRVNSEIRQMVVFAPHNIIKDPPFTKIDILVCRNLLIYLEPELQKNLLRMFHYSLKNDGLLILGLAETIGNQNSLFSVINPKLRVYKNHADYSNIVPQNFQVNINHYDTFFEDKPTINLNRTNMKAILEKFILENFMSASILIDEKGEIIHILGRTGKFLELAEGRATMNIFEIAREGLKQELTINLRKILKDHKRIRLFNLKIKIENSYSYVNIIIDWIQETEFPNGLIIIVFEEVPPPEIVQMSKKSKDKFSTDLPNLKLETELQKAKEEIRRIYEDMQTSQEELKSANEELQSTNEELQSTNEELTTSKEEMQSMNEELQTVNNELQSKVDDYVRINNDLDNLLVSTEIAILFLDKEMQIRRFTTPVSKIFKLKQSDVGRHFTDLVSNLDYPEIAMDARKVLKSLMFQEKEIKTTDVDKWFRIRIMPYRTLDDRIDGIVITFTDITSMKKLELELNESIKVLQEHKIPINNEK